MPDSQTQQLQAVFAGTWLIAVLVGLVSIVVAIVIWWRIFSKAGYSGAMSLLLFIPIANLVVICILAFGTWPIHRELNALRQQVAMMQPMGQRPQYPPAQQYNPQYPQGQQYR